MKKVVAINESMDERTVYVSVTHMTIPSKNQKFKIKTQSLPTSVHVALVRCQGIGDSLTTKHVASPLGSTSAIPLTRVNHPTRSNSSPLTRSYFFQPLLLPIKLFSSNSPFSFSNIKY